MEDLLTLYPNCEPYNFDFLSKNGHKIYYEECGNPDGKPAIFLHGGPGGGGSTQVRRFFNPDKYRIVIFDQRGCGRSTPHGCLENNTTWDLVDDIESLRLLLNIEKWLAPYALEENQSTKTIALVLAGNLPMVGFHDILAVWITGNTALIKCASKDKVLIPFIIKIIPSTVRFIIETIIFAISKPGFKVFWVGFLCFKNDNTCNSSHWIKKLIWH